MDINMNNNFFTEVTDYKNINLECCCFNMRRVSRAVTQYYDHHLEQVGIRATQFTLLAALATTEAKTLTQIADSLVMDRTTLTRNLKPLEKMQLLEAVGTQDKRSKSYCLSLVGKQLLAKAFPIWQKAQNNLVNAMSEERYKDLQGNLSAFLSVVSKELNTRL